MRGIPFKRTTINLKLYQTYFLYDFFCYKKEIRFISIPSLKLQTWLHTCVQVALYTRLNCFRFRCTLIQPLKIKSSIYSVRNSSKQTEQILRNSTFDRKFKNSKSKNNGITTQIKLFQIERIEIAKQ